MSSLSTVRLRAVGLVSAAVLGVTGLGGVPAPANAADSAATYDPAPVTAGASWLAGQLTGGVLHNDKYDFDDIGLSIDAGTALAAVGGYATTVTAISDAVASQIGSYVGDGTTESYAGALAKAAVFARTAGADPTSYGGVDLISRLEARVQTTGTTAGRISDASAYGDYANVIGQIFAVRALDDAGSTDAASATSYLLQQQCADGFFRQDFSKPDATTQSCDGDASAASNDTTALAIIELQPEAATDPAVAAALTKGVAYLEGVQHDDGSFGDGTASGTANANSTGLAGWALGDEGATSYAEKAAIWVRGHQADDPTACGSKLVPDNGAIAYDDAALAAGRKSGIDDTTQDQFRRATTQALPALQWAPARAGGYVFSQGGRFVEGGSPPPDGFFVKAAAPGAPVCVVGLAKGTEVLTADADGYAHDSDGTVRNRTGATFAFYQGSQLLVSSTILARTHELPVRTPRRVRRGSFVHVVVAHGMLPGEHVHVSYRRPTRHDRARIDNLYDGKIGRSGRLDIRVRLRRPPGGGTLVVKGEYVTRTGGSHLVITRR